MRIGIEASATKTGGAVTHLVEVLSHADPAKHRFTEIHVWAPKITLDRLPTATWLIKHADPVFEEGWIKRAWWQSYMADRELKKYNCDVVLVIGGSFKLDFRPVVTMNRNLLPFSPDEIKRLSLSRTLKTYLLRYTQGRSFVNADGVIFLTEHAVEKVTEYTGKLRGKYSVIPHGVSRKFSQPPKVQKSSETFTENSPAKLIYVSNIDAYKHQDKVAKAVAKLRMEGHMIEISFVGPPYSRPLKRFTRVRKKYDPEEKYLHYPGKVSHDEIHEYYHRADISVFASTCENLPNALLESMASGLPIACSDRRPMMDILGEAGVYFDPEKVEEISSAIKTLYDTASLRTQKAELAFEKAKQYSWERCTDKTLDFLKRVGSKHV